MGPAAAGVNPIRRRVIDPRVQQAPQRGCAVEDWDFHRTPGAAIEKADSVTLSLGERGNTPLYLGIASVMVTTVAYRVSLTAWRLVMSLTSYFREKAEEIRKRSEEI